MYLYFFFFRVHEDKDWQMVEKNGKQFAINGQPFYVNGFNTYWLMVFAADDSTRGKVTEVFKQASSVGLTVCRTWAFNDGQWRALQKSPGVYDEDVFKVTIIPLWGRTAFCYATQSSDELKRNLQL